jgi:tetratricopeptide (TPR) repeat protein
MPSPKAPEIYQRPLAEFPGSDLLPDQHAEQVIASISLNYAAKGWNAAVTVNDGMVRVLAVPQSGLAPKEYLLGLLRSGFIEDALAGLEAMYGMMDDADIDYNYGVALSELGRVEESLVPLRRCLSLDPDYTNATIALGVSLSKLERYDEAETALRLAANTQPDNALIKQNLAATLARADKPLEALPFFRQAVSLAPNNPSALLGLAQCLNEIGGDHRKEALKVYREVAKRFPDTEIAEVAKKVLNRKARDDLRGVVNDGIRPDAVEYMIAAMKRFSAQPRERIGQIVLEIAQLGQQGLAVNDPSTRYKLKTLDGDFTGLQLLSYMHVGMKMVSPNADTGSGLDREYEIAKGMTD